MLCITDRPPRMCHAWFAGALLVMACGGRATESQDDTGRSPGTAEGDGDGRRNGDGDARAPTGGTSPGGTGGAIAAGGSTSTGGSPPVASSGGALGSGGVTAPGTGGESMVGSGGASTASGGAAPLDAPWDKLYGHYDLFVVPEDLDCEGLKGHLNFSLRAGNSGPEARVFRNFEWNGWPDAVEEDPERRGIWLHPGPRESLDGALDERGIFLTYDEDGFVFGLPAGGHGTVLSECESGGVEQPAEITIRPDQTSPHVRESFSTRFNFYPFTWTSFRFSEPLGFTTDSYPWGSFSRKEDGEALIALRSSNMDNAPPGEFAQWPWGPVFELVVTDPALSRGGSVWYELIGEEWDDAGNQLVSDLPILGVVDIGPLEVRHDFDTKPPLVGFSNAEWIAPGPDTLCENGGGCVVIEQQSAGCDLEGHLLGAAPEQFAFRVGGPDVPGGLTKGVRVRYRLLATEQYGLNANYVFIQDGTIEYTPTLGELSNEDGPVKGWPYATPWSEFLLQNALGPSEEFALALSWDCPYGLQPSRALVIEWVEAVE